MHRRKKTNNSYPTYQNGCLIFDDDIPYEVRQKINRELESLFSISYYDIDIDIYRNQEYKFLNCSNYEDYVK